MRRAVIGATLVALIAYGTASRHVRAASLMVRFSSREASPRVAAIGECAVDELATELQLSGGEHTRARVYTPRGVADPPGIVLLHGVHRLGVDEPRLQRFARAIASSGVVVYTPELAELRDYRVDLRSTETIGRAAQELSRRVGRMSVGVMGMSFAGGLSLLTAADPAWASDISFVVGVGAHDDLARVSRFFATDAIDEPNGQSLRMHAHDYGALVLVYAHIDHLFSPEDAPIAKEAIRLWLWEDPGGARTSAERLSPAGREKMGLLFDHREDLLSADLLAIARDSAAEMARVSPHGNLSGLRANVYLLHGAGDTVIPPSETRWLASDAPEGSVKAALVSSAIQHVEIHGEPSLRQRWELVHFMALVLCECDAEVAR